MFNIQNWAKLNLAQQQKLLKRPTFERNIKEKVKIIIDQVHNGGDQAVLALTQSLDKVALDSLQVSSSEIAAAQQKISSKAFAAIERATKQISSFHQAQCEADLKLQVSPGIHLQKQTRPITSVGLYIPGGSAPLLSTVLMLGIPAKIAACPKVILCTPPNQLGEVDPHILVAAKICGITEIFKIGGAQAIAAMAYGTQTISKVFKIFGPGNAWVTEAKLQVAQDPQGAAIDMPAGPSEVLIVADSKANPCFIAADLLSQAEHGPDSQVVLLATDAELFEQVKVQLTTQLSDLPRKAIAEQALANSLFIKVHDTSQAIEVSNLYAPEHLLLHTTSPRDLVASIENAGSVFLGELSAEALGDYASGTNHVLPTNGAAKAFSGISVASFMKKITFQEVSPQGLKDIGAVVETLAEIEGLQAHARAVRMRLNQLKQASP